MGLKLALAGARSRGRVKPESFERGMDRPGAVARGIPMRGRTDRREAGEGVGVASEPLQSHEDFISCRLGPAFMPLLLRSRARLSVKLPLPSDCGDSRFHDGFQAVEGISEQERNFDVTADLALHGDARGAMGHPFLEIRLSNEKVKERREKWAVAR